ncbi:hypothetical protein ACTMPR_17295 [Salmonella enterica subsp. enterica serovar Rochdale]
MEEFKGTPGVWDIDINDQTVLSDAGYKVADIDRFMEMLPMCL